MKQVRRRITKLVKLENEHCGHEPLVIAAMDERLELEGFIRDELEWLVSEVVRKGGKA